MSIEILTKKDLQVFGNDLINQIHSRLKFTQKEYQTKTEAMESLQCSSRQLEVLRGERKIAFTRVGREYQYKTTSINNLLNSKLIDVVH
jgi:hypothetical protein